MRVARTSARTAAMTEFVGGILTNICECFMTYMTSSLELSVSAALFHTNGCHIKLPLIYQKCISALSPIVPRSSKPLVA